MVMVLLEFDSDYWQCWLTRSYVTLLWHGALRTETGIPLLEYVDNMVARCENVAMSFCRCVVVAWITVLMMDSTSRGENGT